MFPRIGICILAHTIDETTTHRAACLNVRNDVMCMHGNPTHTHIPLVSMMRFVTLVTTSVPRVVATDA